MKEVKRKDLEKWEYYLVFIGQSFSPSGYDIARWDGKILDSQTVNEDLFKMEVVGDGIKIYELPI